MGAAIVELTTISRGPVPSEVTTIVLASRRRADALAFANSFTSRRAPSSISFTLRTSARSKLMSSPFSEAITSAWLVTAGGVGHLFHLFFLHPRRQHRGLRLFFNNRKVGPRGCNQAHPPPPPPPIR